jgi:hypothetical protein
MSADLNSLLADPSRRAASTTSRSIFFGQSQSKSAMGLNLWIPDRLRRHSRLLRERSSVSISDNCSSNICGDHQPAIRSNAGIRCCLSPFPNALHFRSDGPLFLGVHQAQIPPLFARFGYSGRFVGPVRLERRTGTAGFGTKLVQL